MRWSKRSVIAATHDMGMAALSLPLAFYMRLGDDAWSYAKPYIVSHYVLFMACFAISMVMFRLPREVWRYVSVNELKTLAKVVTVSIVLTYSELFLLQRLEGVPRSLPVLHWLVLAALLSGPRLLYRLMKESDGHKPVHREHGLINLVIVGANDHADAFIRTLQRHPDMPYHVVGIIDDNTARHGRSLRGVTIHGGLKEAGKVIGKLERAGRKPQRLVLTEAYLDQDKAAPLWRLCEVQGIGLARLPRLTDFETHAAPDLRRPFDIRPVAIEDLLGRPQSAHDPESMHHLLHGKRVMITGAGGSIGRELATQIAQREPAEVILVEHSEYNLYQVEKSLRQLSLAARIHSCITDIRDEQALRHLMAETKPEILFHAAALKHVPLVEDNPAEAVLTNVFGTRNVAQTGVASGIETMVLISTDKAVNPSNVMGATKRLAECVWAQTAQQARESRMVMVRFGNVLGSTGSVIPLFEEQMRMGGPLTVTHPEMERYFMTIREAAGLVIQAAALDEEQCGLYILDMGKPVKIVDLAEQMIRLAGFTPYEDIPIIFTGLRPGEKLSEELTYLQENLTPTRHPRISKTSEAGSHPLPPEPLSRLREACRLRDVVTLRECLHALVPGYKTTGETNVTDLSPRDNNQKDPA